MKPLKEQALRCAIYTRKSSEEGLEQDFNSLHAQREACEAYIRSQQGEGWRLRKTPYNDGGLSGATMERPALKQLLADIEEGLVDVVVVYKVDRLTRSLILREMRKLSACSGDAHGACFAHLLEQSFKRLHVAPKPGKGEAEPSRDFVVSACRFAFRGILTGVFDLPIDD